MEALWIAIGIAAGLPIGILIGRSALTKVRREAENTIQDLRRNEREATRLHERNTTEMAVEIDQLKTEARDLRRANEEVGELRIKNQELETSAQEAQAALTESEAASTSAQARAEELAAEKAELQRKLEVHVIAEGKLRQHVQEFLGEIETS